MTDSRKVEGIDYIVCPICGKKLKQINYVHLRVHDMTVDAFKLQFPNCGMYCKKTKDKKSGQLRQQWKNEEFRKKMEKVSSDTFSSTLKNLWKDPEYRERKSKEVSETNKRSWEDPKYREKMSKLASKRLEDKWKDPEYREMKSEEMSNNIKKLWEDPEHRKMMSERMKELWKDPEYMKIKSKVSKRNWEDPEYREMMTRVASETMTKTLNRLWKDPEYIEKMSEIRKENWKDPDYREMMLKTSSETMSRLWEDPEFREKMTEIAVNRLEDPDDAFGSVTGYRSGYYKDTDIYMRSSWEIKFASQLDDKGVAWEYEPGSFYYMNYQGDKHRYLPDFYLPKYDLYFEVKPEFRREEANEKIVGLLDKSIEVLTIPEDTWDEFMRILV